jgi:hypothetical protein
MCFNSLVTCDCPSPPDEACIESFPLEGVSPTARWAPGPFTGARAAWAGAWVWAPNPTSATRYLVTLHGTDELAEKELYWWQPRVEKAVDCFGLNLGIIAVQYHDPAAATEEGYVANEELYELVDHLLSVENQQARADVTGHIFHGFSRGSANMYSLAIYDGPANRWGTRYIANSGAWRPDSVPPPAIAGAVDQNNTTALAGVAFYIYFGGQDHDPDQNGRNGQTNAAAVVTTLGATTRVVEYPSGCHSAMETGMGADQAWPALLWALGLD